MPKKKSIDKRKGSISNQVDFQNIARSQAAFYEAFYQQVDPAETDRVSPFEAAAFLQRSGLPDTILSKIWDISDPQGKGFLDKRGFYIALKMIALHQNGKEITLDNLNFDLPPPQMQIASDQNSPVVDWNIKSPEGKKYDICPVAGKPPDDKVKPAAAFCPSNLLPVTNGNLVSDPVIAILSQPGQGPQNPPTSHRNSNMDCKMQLHRLKAIRKNSEFERAKIIRNRENYQKSSNIKLSYRIEDLNTWGFLLETEYKSLMLLEERLMKDFQILNQNIRIIQSLKDSAIKTQSLREEYLCLGGVPTLSVEAIDNEIEILSSFEAALSNNMKDITRIFWEVKSQSELLHQDLVDKELALKIDKEQLQLQKPAIKVAPYNAMSRPMITLEAWIGNASKRKMAAECILRESRSLLTDISQLIQRFKSDLIRWHDDLLLTIQEDTDALLQDEKSTTSFLRDISNIFNELKQEYQKLDQALNKENDCINLAATRIKNRDGRPHLELVIDDAHTSLISEYSSDIKDKDIIIQNMEEVKSSIVQAWNIQENYKKNIFIIKRKISLNQEILQLFKNNHGPNDVIHLL